jgi:hypothetical protein
MFSDQSEDRRDLVGFFANLSRKISIIQIDKPYPLMVLEFEIFQVELAQRVPMGFARFAMGCSCSKV